MELVTKQIQFEKEERPIQTQFFIDEDINVPDSKYDVAKIVLGKGTVKVEEIRRAESYVKLTGNLLFRILYMTEEGETRLTSMEGKVPFEETLYPEKDGMEPFYVKEKRVDFHASMIHSRKLNVRALVEVTLKRDGVTDKELTTDVEEGGVRFLKKQRQQELLTLRASKNDTYRIKEAVTIPGTKENIGTLLWTDVESRRMDTALGSEELRISGELQLFCIYDSLDGKTDWVEQVVPYEGRVEYSGVDETMYHHVIPELTDVNVEARMDGDGEFRVLGIEGTLSLRIRVYEETKTDILEDVYSLEKECAPRVELRSFNRLVLQNHSKCKVTELLAVPELGSDVLQIVNSAGALQMEKMEPVDGGIEMEGVLHITFLYVRENDEAPFDTWSGIVPFTYLLQAEEIDRHAVFDVTHFVEQLSVSLMGSGEIEVKAALAFHSLIQREEAIPVIEEMNVTDWDLEEEKKRPGIVGYIVKEGDDLWEIAKRYKTTEESLIEVNEMSEKKLNVGEKILIFKESMSIL